MIHALSSALRRFGWIVGLPGVAVLVGVAVPLVTPPLEAHLDAEADRVARETAPAGAEPWLRATARGRDLAVSGEAPDAAARDAALARLAALPGLRRIDGTLSLVETAAPFVWTATRTRADRIDLTGHRPAEIGPRALTQALTAILPPGTRIVDGTHAAYGAPADFKEAATDAVLALRALQPGARAELADTKLSVRGEAASTAEEAALRTALATPPTGFTLGTIEILPARVPDFSFAILRAPGGGIGLTGYVASESARAALKAGATEIAEGAGFLDETRTARGLDPRIDPAGLGAFMLRLAALIQDGRVAFAQGAVTVMGVALDGQAPGEIAALLRDARPAGVEAGPVRIETRPLSPYRVQLRREADSVTLGGHLPDAATRDRILATLRPRFFHERIVDRTRLAEGAPAGLTEALEAGAEALSVMARGEVRVADRSLTLTGDSLYPEAARRLEGSLPRALPAGWQATAAVAVPGVAVPPSEAECRARFAALEPPKALAFSPGSATVTAPLYPLLDGVAAWAKACPLGRVAVAGHLDPAATAPAPKPTVDTAVDSTASVEKAPEAKATATKPSEAKAKPGQTKPGPTKPSQGKPGPAAKPEKPAAEAPPEPEPDLPRQRALALAEYLLEAGLPPDRIATDPAARAPAEGIGLALRP
ncbi:hypothetical protein [Methylobacterium gossipiicola]|uniref:BON domain-containing protein n=1 Tax=Methylobacterium gossipiicola TaxID=582675 RepID=A0A1I2UK92_9HYPH|nr:hypothetical protein [Methylobacterium gossipiicola]SFG76057.1 hypothetical protein SAMN05192565_11061 [Methylobacterium gossipiicola]